MNSTRFQQYRQIPSHEFRPLETYGKLPTGAFVGQIIELEAPDSPIYQVAYYDTARAVPANNALSINATFRTSTVVTAAKRDANSIRLRETSAALENHFAYGKLHVIRTSDSREFTYTIWRNTASVPASVANMFDFTVYIDGQFAADIGTSGYTVAIISNQYNDVRVANEGRQSSSAIHICAGFNEVALPSIAAGAPGVYFLVLKRGTIRLTAGDTINAGDPIKIYPTADTDNYGRVSAQVASDLLVPVGYANQGASAAGNRFWAYVDI